MFKLKLLEVEEIKNSKKRGLKTKIITNGVQGLLFTVIWKILENKI